MKLGGRSFLAALSIASTIAVAAYFLFTTPALGCTFETKSPADQLIEGPFDFDRSWRTIHLTRPLQTLPFTQKLLINADRSTHDLFDTDLGLAEYPEVALKPFNGGPAVVFEVILVTASKMEIHLRQSTSGYLNAKGELLPTVGYGIGHPDSNQIYLPEGLQISSLKIRSSEPIKVKSVEWKALSFHHDPCRTWTNTSTKDKTYHPGEPQPQRGKVSIENSL